MIKPACRKLASKNALEELRSLYVQRKKNLKLYPREKKPFLAFLGYSVLNHIYLRWNNEDIKTIYMTIAAMNMLQRS